MALNRLPEQEKLNNFFKKFRLVQYGKRELILHASDTPSSVFFIEKGYIRVYRLSEQGEELTLTILKPGDLFPLTYGMQKTENQYFLESMTDLTLRKAPQEVFLTFIQEDQAMFYRLITKSFIQFEGFLRRLEYFINGNAYAKVATVLVACANALGDKDESGSVTIPFPLTHRDLATMIGLTRETTSLEMKKLENKGYITKYNKCIKILNQHLLEDSVRLGIDLTDAPLSLSYR